MGLRIAQIVFDCHDPTVLATFWASALGLETNLEDPDNTWAYNPTGARPYLLFNRVQEEKTAKNRLHLDLTPDDLNAEVARLESLGARRLMFVDEGPQPWWVMADPEGNEFCVP